MLSFYIFLNFLTPNKSKAISSYMTKTPIIVKKNDIVKKKYETKIKTVKPILQLIRDGSYQ